MEDVSSSDFMQAPAPQVPGVDRRCPILLPVQLITLFGRPGAGKTTVGDRLAGDLGFAHLPLGRMLKDPKVCQQIGIDFEDFQYALKTGRTIDAEVLYHWLDKQIRVSTVATVVDGYPRVASALPHFNLLARSLGVWGSVVALHLDCSPQVGESRVLARGREDDRQLAYGRRNDEFESVQRPLLDQLDPCVRRVRIDASCASEFVVEAVLQALGLKNT